MNNLNCIAKFRDKHGRIIGYRLVDSNGDVIDVTNQELKNVVNAGQAMVFNLKIGADGRFIIDVPSFRCPNSILSKLENKNFETKHKENKATIVDISNLAYKSKFRDLIDAFKQAYNESNTDARIFILKYYDIEKQNRCELDIGFKRKTSYLSSKLKSITKHNNDYILFRVSDNINMMDGQLGKYEVKSIFGIWNTDSIPGLVDLMIKFLSSINSYTNNYKYLVYGIDDTNATQYFDWSSGNFGIESVDSELDIIGGNIIYMFPKNNHLEHYEIPRYATTISLNAFDNCDRIKSVKVFTKAQYIIINTLKKNRGMQFNIEV